MTDEEKEALEILNNTEWDGFMITIKNLIEKQSKEIEHQKEKRENQKKELAILNAKQIEFNKLVNTVNSYKGQFKRQQKEIEELKKQDLSNTKIIANMSTRHFNDREKIRKYESLQDKIKAKIEEVKDGTFDAKIVLQSLLEKE